MNKQQFTWQSAALTDVGLVRSINEDAILSQPDLGLWLVADGMGGHDAGDLASQTIVNSLNTMYQAPFIEAYAEAVQARLCDINAQLLQLAQQRNNNTTIGSTVAILLAVQNRCAVLWVGDSRVYRLRRGRFEAMSKDHSQVQELVDQGIVAAEDAESHPAANVITRAIGAMDELVVDVKFANIQDGDHYLVCSDGLFKEVTEQEIYQAMQRFSDSQSTADYLLELAKSRAARDNISVISVVFSQGTVIDDSDRTQPFFSLAKWQKAIKSS